MSFFNIEFLYLLLLIPIYIFKYKIDKNTIFYLLSFSFLILALARPIYFSKQNSINSLDIEFVVALDLSKSMQAQDIKPNRFEFAKQKIQQLVKHLSGEKISLLGFSNQSFMIIPSTNNYEIIKFLSSNINIENININGTNFLSVLKATNEILNHRVKKALLILSDGADFENFDEEIRFAKQNNISVYIYSIASKNGSPIEHKNELVKDKNGNIVISKANENIKKLSIATAAIYQEYSLKNDDLEDILSHIKKSFDTRLNIDDLENKKEFFYVFLVFSIIFLIFARFNIKFFR